LNSNSSFSRAARKTASNSEIFSDGAPVTNVFDNLLPDNNSIRKQVAERVRAEGIDAFSLLAEVIEEVIVSGPEGMAAVQSQLPYDYPVKIAEAIFAGIRHRLQILERHQNADTR
jgi:hypothetical protein